MDPLDLFLQQLTDPFRIGLLAMLVLTAARTAADTGWVIPIGLGGVFVAILLPLSFGSASSQQWLAMAVGVASNALILAALVGGVLLYRRLNPPKR